MNLRVPDLYSKDRALQGWNGRDGVEVKVHVCQTNHYCMHPEMVSNLLLPANWACSARFEPRHDACFVEWMIAGEGDDYLFTRVFSLQAKLVFTYGAIFLK